MSTGTTRLRVSTGMAKPTPALMPVVVRMAVFMPMSRPARSSSGPPELPGLMAASVCTASTMWVPKPVRMSRPRAEMTPAVRVWSRPNGLPMAMTIWPTCRLAEVPRGSGPHLLQRGEHVQHGDVQRQAAADHQGLVGLAVGEGDLELLGLAARARRRGRPR